MGWVDVKCTLQTPLFTAGWPGRAQPIRGSSVRGVLGFWLRAVVGSRVGNDLGLLARWQRRVLGDTERQSPTVVRVKSPLLPAGWTECPWPNDCGIVYLLGQGLFKLGERIPGTRDRKPPTVPPYLDEDKSFTLRFRLPADENATALFWTALWCATNFGGLGARTRRGFGRFTVDIKDAPVPSWWAEPKISRPTTGHAGYVGLPDPLRAAVDTIDWSLEEAAAEEQLAAVPLYPRFDHRDAAGDDWFSAIAVRPGRPAGKWCSCLDRLGQEWQEFRRPKTYLVEGRTHRHTPEWRDTVIPAIPALETGQTEDSALCSGRFPLGTLGLPVVFTDKNNRQSVTVNLCTSDVDDQHRNEDAEARAEARLASPVWLHPVQGIDQQWRIRTLTFVHTMAPAGKAPGITKVTPLKGTARVPGGAVVRGWAGLDPKVLRDNHTAWVNAKTRPEWVG